MALAATVKAGAKPKAPKLAKISVLESDVEIAFLAVCDELKESLIVWRNSQVGRTYRGGLGTGSPDYVGIVRSCGVFIAIELKAPKKDATDAQREWLEDVVKAGGEALVINTIDKTEIRRALGEVIARARYNT